MIGVILIAVLNVAMFAWFFYLAAKDPSNVFKRRRPPTGDDNSSTPTASGADQGGIQPPTQG
ncbi:MAG: hypothetical protein B7Y35_05240 [Sphingomonadales bacterium 28-64-96]|nr:MAG: hypothetical protein B7Y35_05240 [Sphingomonadales bacterium 28-64-96]